MGSCNLAFRFSYGLKHNWFPLIIPVSTLNTPIFILITILITINCNRKRVKGKYQS